MGKVLGKVKRGGVKTSDTLIRELKGLVRGLPISVIGRMDLTAGKCCRDGTYAIVKIDTGRPVPLVKKSRK